ncbi:hypothetical protein O1611_g436 [Lasiodiplodia mahajangana]|uniref:Uncharacterized protein n=1 Tax=Lasiodiplodia mahajangana TaxID=1108764 RepID=A0ACC2K0X3_9PEZI|nr:hypothetical protein O1611_g436 [Lasiodiplodia mahajangana]
MMTIAIAVAVVTVVVLAAAIIVKEKSDRNNGPVTFSLPASCYEERSQPTMFDEELTDFRRALVILALSVITGLDSHDITDRILDAEETQCPRIFERTRCTVASKDYVSYAAERSTREELLREHGKSPREYPWVFGDYPAVWRESLPLEKNGLTYDLRMAPGRLSYNLGWTRYEDVEQTMRFGLNSPLYLFPAGVIPAITQHFGLTHQGGNRRVHYSTNSRRAVSMILALGSFAEWNGACEHGRRGSSARSLSDLQSEPSISTEQVPSY